ncbi:MAG: DNA-formamidopyrimidine glycosylase family protein, partial [Armatimonadota bacterium]
MPELPDIELYIACLRPRVVGRAFSEFKQYNPFALRTVTPRPAEFLGVAISGLERIGKRVAFGFENGYWMVVHLMVSGRFRWVAPESRTQPKVTHATWRFDDGLLVLTEASSKKRAGIWLFANKQDSLSIDPGGIDPLSATPEEFRA